MDIVWTKSSYSLADACVEVGQGLFRKSSHSCDTANCVEVSTPAFRKSSRSGGNDGGDCVEVANCSCIGASRTVLVRDSKDRRADAPVLAFGADSWRAFLRGLRAGELVAP